MTIHTPTTLEPAGARAVDPDLVRVITRVAHRAYLVDAARPATTTRPERHRPAPRRAGTTARKVTRSR